MAYHAGRISSPASDSSRRVVYEYGHRDAGKFRDMREF